jgi:hypothetical protein
VMRGLQNLEAGVLASARFLDRKRPKAAHCADF